MRDANDPIDVLGTFSDMSCLLSRESESFDGASDSLQHSSDRIRLVYTSCATKEYSGGSSGTGSDVTARSE